MNDEAMIEAICRELVTLRGGNPDEVIETPQPSHIVGVVGYRQVRLWTQVRTEVLDALTMQQAIMSVASKVVEH